MAIFQDVIPPSGGSVISENVVAGGALIHNIANNLRVLGLAIECMDKMCYIDMGDPLTQTRVLMLAILGNFVNKDLLDDDAIEHLQVDTATGLVRRAHSDGWTRVMLTDILLVLAVVMLGVRALKPPPHPVSLRSGPDTTWFTAFGRGVV